MFSVYVIQIWLSDIPKRQLLICHNSNPSFPMLYDLETLQFFKHESWKMVLAFYTTVESLQSEYMTAQKGVVLLLS